MYGYKTYGVTDRPNIELTRVDEYPGMLNELSHNELLSYLHCRLDDGNRRRADRLRRYSNVDKTISTWQRLSMADTERKEKQENSGQAQALNMNLPLTHTHTEDMVALFSAIYAPTQGDFVNVPDKSVEEQSKNLIEKMNADGVRGKYFKELCKMLRSIFKYNISGFVLDWNLPPAETNDEDKGWNLLSAIDQYNFIWDTTLVDPADIAKKAEWAAIFSRESRMHFIKGDGSDYVGLSGVLDKATNGSTAKYYRSPPNYAGIGFEDAKTSRGQSMDWEAYGAGLINDGAVDIGEAFEKTRMWCWLNAADFGLGGAKRTGASYIDKLTLWEFTIVGDERIVAADPVMVSDVPADTIPLFVGFLNQDEMGEAQRSQVELMTPFQNYASFIVNADVQGTRSAIYGLQGYDPQMFDMASLPAGAVSGRIPSKIPGRDVRTGLQNINTSYDSSGSMQKFQQLMALLQQFFPSQALPNQIAGMDRAIQSQVAAVMQGVSRRLHMLVRVLDDDVFNPIRMGMYRNIVAYSAANTQGVNDTLARKILGSGLQQLNREAAAQAMQQLLFAVIQNPQSASEVDILGLMAFWGNLLNMSIDLNQFKRQAAPPVNPNDPNTQGAPGAGAGPGGVPAQGAQQA